MTDFYGKDAHGNLVRIDSAGIVWDVSGAKIGVTQELPDELHVTGAGHYTSTNPPFKDVIVYGMRSGRSDKDEMWHRWASLGQDKSYLDTKKRRSPTLAMFRTNLGRAKVAILSIVRNGKEIFNGEG